MILVNATVNGQLILLILSGHAMLYVILNVLRFKRNHDYQTSVYINALQLNLTPKSSGKITGENLFCSHNEVVRGTLAFAFD